MPVLDIRGDSAYQLKLWLMKPSWKYYARANQIQCTNGIDSYCMSVEHSCKDLKQKWISQDFARNLKVRKAPIALLYKSSAILWNFRTFFMVVVKRSAVSDPNPPPSFEEYMKG